MRIGTTQRLVLILDIEEFLTNSREDCITVCVSFIHKNNESTK